MSTEWPLRQDPEGPVIIALALVNDPDALGFVVLDDEDDWFISDGTELSDDVLVNRENFGKLSLREAVELLPQLGALAGLPTGMAADWDPERRCEQYFERVSFAIDGCFRVTDETLARTRSQQQK